MELDREQYLEVGDKLISDSLDDLKKENLSRGDRERVENNLRELIENYISSARNYYGE